MVDVAGDMPCVLVLQGATTCMPYSVIRMLIRLLVKVAKRRASLSGDA